MMTYLLVIVSFTLGFMFSALLGRNSLLSSQKKKYRGLVKEESSTSDFMK